MSNKLSTLDIPESQEGTQKTLQPGNTIVKINSISLKTEPFDGSPVNIILSMEGEDLGEEFEGFAYDKSNPDLGVAKGQVAFVRAQPYSFSDKTASGKKLNRDVDMLKWLQNFCKAMGKLDWLKGQDNLHETVESLIHQLNTDKVYSGLWFNVCLAGKAYTSNKGFLNYDLFLPWFNKEVPLELVQTEPSKLLKFDTTVHIIQPKEKKEIPGFVGKKSKDFDL